MVDIQTEKTIDAIYEDLFYFLPADLRDNRALLDRFAYIKDNIQHLNNREIMEGLGVPPSKGNCDHCPRCRRD